MGGSRKYWVLGTGYSSLLYLPGVPSRSHLDAAGGEEFLYFFGTAFGTGKSDRFQLLDAQDFVKAVLTFTAFEFV